MAKRHYNADSASLRPLSLHPGISGSRRANPAKTVSFPASSVKDTSPAPAPYMLAGGATMYVGKNAQFGRWLPNHGTVDAKPGLSGPSPIPTSIN
jgi:hypothetical protein